MSTTSSSCSSVEQCSNLENFLHSVTPVVDLVSVLQVQGTGESNDTHLKLQDIWEVYDEWSSCGVGTSVSLKNSQNIVQYFVPYLSAIQIFVKKSTPPGFEDEIDRYGSSSDDDVSAESKSNSPRKEAACNGFKTVNGRLLGDHDRLYVQFYETCSPYSRVPLLDKIVELAQSYPGLLTFNVNDISPASWMSVAWYPIYHIPARVYSTKDLSTCFLTFHTLSSSFQATTVDNYVEATVKDDNTENDEEQSKGFNSIDLVPFGLATYKMQGDVWNSGDKGDDERMQDLESAASSWLKQLHIHHHDFIFFTQSREPSQIC